MDSTIIDTAALTTWLYFFSSVFQGNAALLSVLAVFVVLRYQSLSAQLQELDARIEAFVALCMRNPDRSGITVPYASVAELPEIISQTADKRLASESVFGASAAGDLRQQRVWPKLFEARNKLLVQRKRLLSELGLPAVPLALLTLSSLTMIPQYDTFDNSVQGTYVSAIAAEVIAVILIFRYVYHAMKTGDPKAAG